MTGPTRLLTPCLVAVLLAGCGGSEAASSARPVVVGYFVTGTAGAVDVTLSDGDGGTQQASDRSVPLTSGSGNRGLHMTMQPGAFAYISAQNTDESGSVTCRITFDGVTVKQSTSEGAYTVTSCSATVS